MCRGTYACYAGVYIIYVRRMLYSSICECYTAGYVYLSAIFAPWEMLKTRVEFVLSWLHLGKYCLNVETAGSLKVLYLVSCKEILCEIFYRVSCNKILCEILYLVSCDEILCEILCLVSCNMILYLVSCDEILRDIFYHLSCVRSFFLWLVKRSCILCLVMRSCVRSCILWLVMWSCNEILYLPSCAYCISKMLRNAENKSGIWGETAGSLQI